ncbi:MAG: hypothetical protein N0E42_12050 [Candidatus Thiodiazotropha endolucinida]|nr:hypothetical protein [Candidatus Thiodiazotropha endolucinida]
MTVLFLAMLPSIMWASPHFTVMPIDKLLVLETKHGLNYISGNARYVIEGRIIDTWDRKELLSIDDIKYSNTHINMENMGVDINRLNAITVGDGNHRVYVFIDPVDAHSLQLVRAVVKRSSLADYKYTIILIPALGSVSHYIAKQLACAESNNTWLEAYLNGKLPEPENTATCSNNNNYYYTLKVAEALNIKYIPLTIASDGRYKTGYDNETFWEWLKEPT